MCKGYRHQINFLVASLTEKIDHLESTVIKGAKDERVIKPEMDEVQKAMEKYQKGMKTIKAAFVFCLNYFAHVQRDTSYWCTGYLHDPPFPAHVCGRVC